MRRTVFRNQRGSVAILFMGTLFLMLSIGGLATDFGYFVSVQSQLRRSMDAAALAGAGNLASTRRRSRRRGRPRCSTRASTRTAPAR